MTHKRDEAWVYRIIEYFLEKFHNQAVYLLKHFIDPVSRFSALFCEIFNVNQVPKLLQISNIVS